MKLKDLGLTKQDIKDKVSKYMIDTYERFDFLAETAEGMYMYDEKGTPYLDFYAGIAVNNAGSRNPKVVAAVKDQVDDIMHTFNYPYTIPQALLAEKVCTTIGMDKIFYQNSGTEANEAMIKIIRYRALRTKSLPYRNCEDGLPRQNIWCDVCNRSAGQWLPGRIWTDDIWFLLCAIQQSSGVQGCLYREYDRNHDRADSG